MSSQQTLADRVDQELNDDRKFFQEHPDRQYRVRPCFLYEGRQFSQIAGWRPPEGSVAYIVVHQVRPGVRERRPFAVPCNSSLSATEAAAAQIFNELGAAHD